MSTEQAIPMATTPINTETFLRRPTAILDSMSPEFFVRWAHIYVSLTKAKEDRKRLAELNPAPASTIRLYDQLIASLEKFDGGA